MRRRSLALAAVLVATLAHAQPSIPSKASVWLSKYVDCNYFNLADQATQVQAAIDRASGKTLVWDAFCVPFISGPSAGGAKLSIPSGTTIIAEGGTAGVRLAYKTCDGTATSPGRACSTDDTNATTGCPGATCPGCCDAAGGSASFAPTGGSSYTVFKAASSSSNITIDGLSIYAGGIEPFTRCGGGSNADKICSTANDCGAGTCSAGTCSGGARNGLSCDCPSSTCGNSTAGAPSGAGKINVFDLSTATYATLRNVNLYDHRQGEYAVSAGANAVIEKNRLTRTTQAAAVAALATAAVESSIIVTNDAQVVRNHTGGSGDVIRLNGSGSTANDLVEGNTIAGQNTTTSWGVKYTGGQHRIVNNFTASLSTHIGGTCDSANATIADNRLYFGGRKILCVGAGCKVHDNYLAWDNAGAPVVQLGDASTIGCAAAHAELHDNLFFGQATSNANIYFADVGKRCNGGSRIYLACTTDDTNGTTGCPGAGCPSCCINAKHENNNIGNNTILGGGTTNIGIDLSAIGANTTVVGLLLDGFLTSPSPILATGLKFPASYQATITKVLVRTSIADATDRLANWDWRYGTLMAGGPFDADDDAAQVAIYTNGNGATLNPGEVVEISSTTNGVKKAVAGSKVPIGVVLDSPADTARAQVATSGVVTLRTTDTTIPIGTRLRVSSTAGYADPAGSTDFAFAIAQAASADQGSYQTVRAVLAPSAGTSTGVAPVVATAQVTGTCDTPASVTNRIAGVIAATGLTGSKTALITASFTFQDGDTGAERIALSLYDNGSTTCDTVCTSATPAGSQLSPLKYSCTLGNGGSGTTCTLTGTWFDTTSAGTNNYCAVMIKDDARTNVVTRLAGMMTVVEYQ